MVVDLVVGEGDDPLHHVVGGVDQDEFFNDVGRFGWRCDGYLVDVGRFQELCPGFLWAVRRCGWACREVGC